ncbi:MAG: PD-(D/E)XK nuclease family protein [Epsilonproteobacteria bacterium]|nr:PD-(D/E)XK nuclease family protein [Campylobacterota bacterium]
MESKTVVLSSSRAIRHAQQDTSKSSLFLPNYITMAEFLEKLCIVRGYKKIDEDSRILLLLQASDFQNFTKLQIERNFFTFTKNSSFILKFFEELSAELVSIDDLLALDQYGEFEEHITILIELYHRYKELCDTHKVIDKIFLPSLYELNTTYLTHHKDIELHLDGYLTNFELKVLQEAAKYVTIHIHFYATSYNKKMQKKFASFGLEFANNTKYIIDLGNEEIIKEEKFTNNSLVTCNAFGEDLLQVAFVKQKIYEFIQKGYDANKIAVIVPDESKAKFLQLFDTKGNFNFAMGKSFKQSSIYKLLDANIKYIEQDSQENRHRIQRYNLDLQTKIIELYGSRGDVQRIVTILRDFTEFIEDKKELAIFSEELHRFEKVLPLMQEMGSKSILTLFMQRLAKSVIDDVSGGKITVMGVLESRGVAFDGVIVIDFNENNVPKKSDKDMFLNTTLREHAKLPTMQDREELQKHYYSMVFQNAQEVAISYIKSANTVPSRFLKQLGIKESSSYSEQDFTQILFRNHHREKTATNIGVIPYSFEGVTLSSSRLKTYLTCKQKYYFRYIKNLAEHEIPQDLPKEHTIGNDIHLALANLYTKKKSYDDLGALQKDLEKELDSVCQDNELMRFAMAMQKRVLRSFCANEIDRFAKGYEVLGCEVKLTREYEGLKLYGVIDRIDKFDGGVSVLDYKTGSYKTYTKNTIADATDFQLEFYHLLASEKYSVRECGFYDLKEGRVVPEKEFEQKLELLQEHLRTLQEIEQIDVQKCEDTKECIYCPYKILCERG